MSVSPTSPSLCRRNKCRLTFPCSSGSKCTIQSKGMHLHRRIVTSYAPQQHLKLSNVGGMKGILAHSLTQRCRHTERCKMVREAQRRRHHVRMQGSGSTELTTPCNRKECPPGNSST